MGNGNTREMHFLLGHKGPKAAMILEWLCVKGEADLIIPRGTWEALSFSLHPFVFILFSQYHSFVSFPSQLLLLILE